ncbi:hypothetical protein V6N11_077383 [Hibiscus sabdariffa]|uniref:Uncharacterized protein n=1 Tax=Hibiscus sabdariffa TaxID=183260 RepID=A0ABR2TCY8_9ROSI
MHEKAQHPMLYLKLYMHISHRCFNILQALFVWKVKSQWTQRQASRSQRSSMRFSYDLHSYSLNFDDGFSRDDPLNPTP